MMRGNSYSAGQLKILITRLKVVRTNYRKSLWWPFFYYKQQLYTEAGLCNAFYESFTNSSIRNKAVDDAYFFARRTKGFEKNNTYAYWFKAGKIRPRLKVLNQLISYYEKLYNQNFAGKTW